MTFKSYLENDVIFTLNKKAANNRGGATLGDAAEVECGKNKFYVNF